MIRLLFFFLFFSYSLLANTILIDNRDEIRIGRNVDIYLDVNTIEEVLTSPVSKKPFLLMHYERQSYKKDHWFKFSLKNTYNYEVNRILLLKWKNTRLKMFLLDGNNILRQEEINIKSKNGIEFKDINIPANKKLDLYFYYDSSDKNDEYSYLCIAKRKAFLDIISRYESFYGHGFFLGLLIIMTVYSIFIYKSTKDQSNLFYALFQLSVISVISDFRFLIYDIFDTYPLPVFIFLKIIIPNMIFVFSALFTQKFLDTKMKFPIVDKVIWIIISYFVVSTVFQIMILNKIIYPNFSSYISIIFVITGIRAYLKGHKSAIFYVIGTSVFIGFLVSYNTLRLLEVDYFIDYMEGLTVAATIEALFLTFAIHYKLKDIVDEKNEQEKMFLAQSRLAYMGEMIGNIAHQWRQPINNISSILLNLSFHNEANKLEKKFLNEKIEEGNRQLQFMSETIEDFRNFFTVERKKSEFLASEVCLESIMLLSANFDNNSISIKKYIKDDFKINGYKSELNQVILILLANAKDALKNSNEKDKKITVLIQDNLINIKDNAGGIDSSIIDKIFDPYFSTKDKKNGTGLGLYIARTIVEERMGGILKVKNDNKGASFFIIL